MSMFIPKNGDVFLTYGQFDIGDGGNIWQRVKRTAQELLLWFLILPAIRRYSQWRWGKKIEGKRIPTHVLIYLNGRLFEITFPKPKWTEYEDFLKENDTFSVRRWSHWMRLDTPEMLKKAHELLQTGKYDIGDLADFELMRVLSKHIPWLYRGLSKIRIFGDAAHAYEVCSTGTAEILQTGGARFAGVYFNLNDPNWSYKPEDLDPAYFVVASEWLPVYSVGLKEGE